MRTKKRPHSSPHKKQSPQQRNLGTQSVLAHAITTDGNGIARGDDGVVIFVKNLLPQEKAVVKIREQKATYKKAEIVKLEQESVDRVVPQCSYYIECGGCQIQHIAWENQAQYKVNWFFETLKRIGKWDEQNIKHAKDILEVVYLKNHHYRRRIRLHFNGKNLGFRQKESHHIINVEHCLTASEQLNQKIPMIKEKLRSLFVSFAGKVKECELELTQGDDSRVLFHLTQSICVDPQTEKNFLHAWEKEFEVQKDQLVNLHLHHMGKFKIKRQSFVQPHLFAMESYCRKMEMHLKDYLKQSVAKQVSLKPFLCWDLYAGSGVFTGLAHHVGLQFGLQVKCIGVEGVPEAIDSLKSNYKNFMDDSKRMDSRFRGNDKSNVWNDKSNDCNEKGFFENSNKSLIEARLQDVTKFIDEQFASQPYQHTDLSSLRTDLSSPRTDLSSPRTDLSSPRKRGSTPDIVILDPPRSGAGIGNMQKLVELCSKNALILYLACDAASFARDTQILIEGGFHLTRVTLFDAFAQTTHYEVLGCFQR